MSSSGFDSLERLQDLHRDLLSLDGLGVSNVERLVIELEQRIEEFQNLLEKPGRNDKSRQALSSGTIQIDDTEYSINDGFKQETIQLADFLDLDELEAARLYLQGQADAQALDRSPLTSAVIIFHQRRHFLTECLRLALQYSSSLTPESPATASDPVWQFVEFVVARKDNKPQQKAVYWRRCLAFMNEIETWLHQIMERLQSMSMVGQAQSIEYTEMMEYQITSLNKQHETLAAVQFYLSGEIDIDDFRLLLSRMKNLEKYDAILIHYIPVLVDAIQQFAVPQHTEAEDARALHEMIMATTEQNIWALRSFQAVAKVIWLPCYNSRFLDAQGSTLDNDDIEGPEKRSMLFMEALRDGAFQLMLSMCRDIRDDVWFDQLRHGITEFLTQDTPALHADPLSTEKFFQRLLVESLMRFIQDFITFMPDTLRRLKVEEDEQRRQAQSLSQLHSADQELHLERFLIIIAYTYEGSKGDAEAFYEKTGNLFGFLQWASQRQSTPRVAAFCEMLRTLSENEHCADLAHTFLLDEGASIAGRSRRGSSLSWAHIFNELEFYSSSIRQKLALQNNTSQIDLVEPESAMMLECYLRLLSHLSKRSLKARQWMLNSVSFNVQDHLFLLCGSSIASRLRACSFSALGALLTNKNKTTRDSMWTALDSWLSGGSPQSIQLTRPAQPLGSSQLNEQLILESICTGFEEPNSFVELLQALVSPTKDEVGLCDNLPFPETLGTTYRMAGIDPYVDFVLGRVFAPKSIELQDSIQLRIMRWNCLNFAVTCLSTFNEDLVVFANRTSIAVDSAISTTSLETYLRIHPFARVMEWFFNEGVIAALFATLQQNLEDVNASAADSPLLLSVICSIQVIDLVLRLQTTYFDIVRPIIKLRSANRRPTVANSALASFEDAILNNINSIANLGLFCGSGHQTLVICSISLLKELCGLRKLSAPLAGVGRKQWDRSRLIAALERNNEVESISRALIAEMLPNEGEFEQGPDAPGIAIKEHLLKFLLGSLMAVTDRPTVAHLLLGFQCHSHSLDVASVSLFADGRSLFHAILKFLTQCPSTGPDTMLSWLTSLKNESWQILAKLWSSPISAYLILPELRSSDFIFFQWLQQPQIGPETLWNDKSMDDPEFFLGDSALGYASFLQQRATLFDYAATELRAADAAGMLSLRNRIRLMLLGSFTSPNGMQSPCGTIFDLVEFLRIDPTRRTALPDSRFFNLGDFDLCKTVDSSHVIYNIQIAEQLLLLRQNELRKQGLLVNAADEKQMQADAQNLLQCFGANNNRANINGAYVAALDSWVKLVIVFLGSLEVDMAQRNTCVAQGLQVMLPYFENFLNEDVAISTILAHLGKALLGHADFTFKSTGSSVSHDPGNERLFRLFSVSLIGLQSPDSPAVLRRLCCAICHEYLHRSAELGLSMSLKRQVLQRWKSVGARLVEVVCDDAYAGEGLCRISSLLLLGTMVAISNQVNSKELEESLSNLNFVQIVVDSMRKVSQELHENEDTAQLLSYHKANLALLLRLSQTRSGATHVMNAAFFDSVRGSGLFTADPDIGIEAENPRALTMYFQLLLAVLQIVNAIVLSRGPQNDQTISQVRQFLQENRSTVVGIFKRNAKIGIAGDVSRVGEENEVVLVELVNNFTILISAIDFLVMEEEQDRRPAASQMYA